MEYMIASAFNEHADGATCDLVAEVERLIGQGFEPIGGVCLVFAPVDRERFTGEDGYLATQSLVKR